MLALRNGVAGAALGMLLVAGTGCPADRERPAEQVAVEQTGVPAPATATEHMHQTLNNLVQAQSAHYEDHGRFAEGPTILMENYGFQPVGGVTAAIHFQGTAPEQGYIATAAHPYSTERCEIHHGRRLDDRPFAGNIVCQEGEGEPMPTDVPLQPIQ